MPALPYHMGYGDSGFAPPKFTDPGVQGPYTAFDAAGDAFTVAVTVTSLPSAAGDGDAVTAMEGALVFAPEGCTVCASASDMLGGNDVVPRYCAAIA